MTENTPSEAMVEAMARAIRDVKGGVNYDYMDFCRDAAQAAAAVIADALAERDARIRVLEDALFDATAMIGHNLTMKATALVAGRTLNAHDVWKAGCAALGSAKV